MTSAALLRYTRTATHRRAMRRAVRAALLRALGLVGLGVWSGWLWHIWSIRT